MNILVIRGACFISYALVGQNAKIKLEGKPKNSTSKYTIPGLYFTDNSVIGFTKEISPSDRGKLDVEDQLKSCFKNQNLTVTVFGRGITWMNSGSIDSLYAAGELISILQKRQSLEFANIKETALRNGWISDSQMIKSPSFFPITSYQKYLLSLLE
jgi:glucose-1-phosphate thymidylyltransferase